MAFTLGDDGGGGYGVGVDAASIGHQFTGSGGVGALLGCILAGGKLRDEPCLANIRSKTDIFQNAVLYIYIKNTAQMTTAS